MLWLSVDVPMERVPFTNLLLMAATIAGSIYYWTRPAGAEVNFEPRLDPILLQKSQDPKLTPKQREAAQQQLDREVQKVIQMADEESAPAGSLNPRRFAPSQLVTHLFVHGDVL